MLLPETLTERGGLFILFLPEKARVARTLLVSWPPALLVGTGFSAFATRCRSFLLFA
ncbi:hypothetical protein [Hymenobacter swuensis]|uniref:Uncharacterized protein n=1 Tax=Hymenobacter swuensis DY53 TaxID=1227739 RepID=W8F620_9BACT|nr:hypothetical protein [Hymenobacter swuensis]AHJ98056.1 hypothetical protein Hsw_2461 [Hymenobacter swuensis DY53]